jgi:hypothetical protein
MPKLHRLLFPPQQAPPTQALQKAFMKSLSPAGASVTGRGVSHRPGRQSPAGASVTGRGVTDEEALKAAFVMALERTVGTIIHSETVSRNF